jgi:hypothetical protein
MCMVPGTDTLDLMQIAVVNTSAILVMSCGSSALSFVRTLSIAWVMMLLINISLPMEQSSNIAQPGRHTQKCHPAVRHETKVQPDAVANFAVLQN